MTKRKVHFSFMSVCVNFISACRRDWCYNVGLSNAEWTYDQDKVTCIPCQKFLESCDQEKLKEVSRESSQSDQ